MRTHLSPSDYSMEKIEIPDGVCYHEPQGNFHYYTTCGHLIKHSGKELICAICSLPVYDGKQNEN